MRNILQRVVAVLLGSALGFAVYVVPDMAANLGEATSFLLKAFCAAVFLAVGFREARRKRLLPMKCMLSAGLVLILLLLFGGGIRLAEVGALPR